MQGEVKYVNRGVEHFGTYKVEGRMLELTCRHGTRRAVLGLFEARALARKLLKFLVTRADREMPCPAQTEVRVTTPRAPQPDPEPAQSLAGWASLPPGSQPDAKRRAAAASLPAA